MHRLSLYSLTVLSLAWFHTSATAQSTLGSYSSGDNFGVVSSSSDPLATDETETAIGAEWCPGTNPGGVGGGGGQPDPYNPDSKPPSDGPDGVKPEDEEEEEDGPCDPGYYFCQYAEEKYGDGCVWEDEPCYEIDGEECGDCEEESGSQTSPDDSGTCGPSGGSISSMYNIGKNLSGDTIGTLYFIYESYSKDILKPSALHLNLEEEGAVVFRNPDYSIRRILTETQITDIESVENGFVIRFYQGLRHKDSQYLNALEPIKEEPMRTVSFNGEESEAGKPLVRITDGYKDKQRDFLFTWEAEDESWTFVKGKNESYQNVRKELNEVDGGFTKHLIQYDESGETVFHRARVRKDFPFGTRQVSETIDTGEAVHQQTASFYENRDADGAAYGKLKSRTLADGSWTTYLYDNKGELTARLTPWKNSELTFDPEAAQAEYFTTRYLEPGEDYYFPMGIIKETRRALLGTDVERSFKVYSYVTGGGRVVISERAHSPSARYGDKDSLRSIQFYNPEVEAEPWSGRIREQHADNGTVTRFHYVDGDYGGDFQSLGAFVPRFGGDYSATERITLPTPDSKGIPGKTTKTVSITSPWRQTVQRENYVLASGTIEDGKWERLDWQVSQYDPYNRLIRTTTEAGIQGEYAYNDCCDKLEWEKRADGTEISYIRDELNRVTARIVQTPGEDEVTTFYTYNALGKVAQETVVAGDIEQTTRNEYNGFGQLIARTTPDGLTTRYQYDEANRRTTTILPGNTARMEERYRDGQVMAVHGNAVVDRFHNYGVIPATGDRWSQTTLVKPDGPRWNRTYTDPLGRTFHNEAPGHGENIILASMNRYDNKGRIISTATGWKKIEAPRHKRGGEAEGDRQTEEVAAATESINLAPRDSQSPSAIETPAQNPTTNIAATAASTISANQRPSSVPNPQSPSATEHPAQNPTPNTQDPSTEATDSFPPSHLSPSHRRNAPITLIGPPTLYVYHPKTGELHYTGQDIDRDQRLTPGSVDRISRADSRYTKQDDHWFQVTRTYQYPPALKGKPRLVSETQRRINGTGVPSSNPDEIPGVLISESRSLLPGEDGDESLETRSQTYRDRDTGTTTAVSIAPTGIETRRTAVGGNIQTVAEYTRDENVTVEPCCETTFKYDPLGRRIATHDPRAGKSSVEYDPATGRAIAQIDPEGRRTELAYYPADHKHAGKLKSTTNPDGKQQLAAYNERGQQTAVWGAATQPLVYRYNEYGELVEMQTFKTLPNGDPSTDPAEGHHTRWHYHEATGALLAKTYADGKGPRYEYSESGQLKARVWARDAEEREARREKEESPSPVAATETPRRGDIPVARTDSATETPAQNPTSNIAATAASNISANQRPSAVPNQQSPPATELPAQSQSEPSNLPTFPPSHGRLATTYKYSDTTGALQKTTYPDGTTITYTYDTTGRLSEVTDPTGTRKFAYNLKNQITSETVTLAEPVNGAPLTYRINRTYTTLNQPESVKLRSLNRQEAPVVLQHDVEYSWTHHNQLADVKSLAGEFRYEYDPANPTLLSQMTGPAVQTQFTYEPHRNLITGVTNVKATGDRQQAEGPSSAETPAQNTTPKIQSPISSYTYANDILGRREEITHGGLAFQQLKLDNTVAQVAYNDRSEVTGATYHTNDELTQSYQYQFDGIGNRESYKAKGQWEKASLTYEANALNQYQKVAKTPAVGEGRDLAQSPPAETSALNAKRPNSVNPSHDLDGNLLFDNKNTYTWNAENRLTTVESKDGKTKVSYAYDYQGRRTVKKVFSRKTGTENFTLNTSNFYVYDGWNLLAEIKDEGRRMKSEKAEASQLSLPPSSFSLNYYTWGRDLSGTLQGAGGVGGLLAITEEASHTKRMKSGTGILPVNSTDKNSEPTTTRYPAYDANGNIGQLVDAQGKILAAYQYDPFGNVTAKAGPEAESNPWRFSSKPVEEVTGWSYYGFRYYMPTEGRWASRDPIEEAGGVNLYGMVFNNPVNQTDFLGWGLWKWFYTGDWNADEQTYEDAVDQYAEYICCYVPCLGEVYKEVSEVVIAGAATIGAADASMEIPFHRKVKGGFGSPEKYQSLGNTLYKHFRNHSNKHVRGFANWARTAGTYTKIPGVRSPNRKVRRLAKFGRTGVRAARGGVTGAAAVTAAVSIYAAYHCAKKCTDSVY